MYEKIEAAERKIWSGLFCPETSMLYELDFEPGKNGYKYDTLPTPEEIADVFPNPMGWGTDMEDSVLNGGVMLDEIVDSYAVDGDEKHRDEAAKIWKGLHLCATISDSPGYLARSVSPYDGKSHYPDSSVDQYTHFIYSAVKFFHSPLASDAQKEEIRHDLVEIAKRAERNVKKENGYNLLREDGYPALITYYVSKDMIYPGIYRWPMIYAGAYNVSGDKHWKALYDSVKDYSQFGKIPPYITFKDLYLDTLTKRISAYTMLQSQLSIRVCYDVEDDPAFRARLTEGLQNQAEMATNYIPLIDYMVSDWKHNYYPRPQKKWRYRKCNILDWTPIYNHRHYVVPAWEPDDMLTIMPPREAGEALLVQTLCPGFKIDPDQFAGTLRIVEKLDFEHYPYSSSVQFAGGCRAYLRYVKENGIG